MSFTYPLGLLALIGVPIVVIIYILKNKYTEQIVTSTYLWTLSEKFLKRKKQVRLVSGIISLILQIVAIVLLSLLLSQPVFSIPNAAKEYCFILDASGSMNMEIEGTSKFEIGKDRIEEMINNATNGSTFTLIYAGTTNKVVYERIIDSNKAIELLNDLKPSGSTSTYSTIIKYVQELFNSNQSLLTYLITDHEFDATNINVINVSTDLTNYVISDTTYTELGSAVKITGNVISYSKDDVITVNFYVDDILANTLQVSASANVKTPFSYLCNKTDFSTIRVEIANQDHLMIDNYNIVYNVEKEHSYRALIVSDRPFYIESIIKTIGNISVEVISRENYNNRYTGYSLYVFDSYSPSVLPTDGAVWLFGVMTNVEGSGFSVQDVVQIEGYDDEGYTGELSQGMLLTYSKNSTKEFRDITSGITGDEIYVAKYAKYGLYRKFTTILTQDGNPAVFTGTTDAGNIEVVFSFDLHDSNLPLLIDYIVLFRNLLTYSFPNIMDKSLYTCGETAVINVANNFDSIRVESPNGDISYLSVNTNKAELQLDEVGIYKITIMIGEEAKTFTLFVSLPEEESNPTIEPISLTLVGEAKNDSINGIYDELLIFFIVLIVIFMADWMVYCYEQRQLR